MRGNGKTQANRLPHGMPHTAGGLSVFYHSLSPQAAERRYTFPDGFFFPTMPTFPDKMAQK